MDTIFISFNRQKLAVSHDGPPHASQTVLFLFGGGRTANKERFRPWQHQLAAKGIASVSFDYTGTGASPGRFEESSLARRIDEACACMFWVLQKNPQTGVTLYGSSMGAYTALGVFDTLDTQVNTIFLVVPAAYTDKAHDIPFGTAFTDLLKVPDSWQTSKSFRWISRFTGTLNVIAAGEDSVVPITIPKTYMERATRIKKKSLHIVSGADHLTLATGNIGINREMKDIYGMLTKSMSSA